MKKQNIYLVANYLAKPKDPRQTHVPGYMKDSANIRYDEQVQVSTRLRRQDLMTAKVIMNLSDKTVEQNSFNGNKNFDELFKYFFKGYHKYITEVMAKLDPEYFNQMLDEMQAELDKEKTSEEVPAE
jgi:fructose-specific phosphotransferase system component IIB